MDKKTLKPKGNRPIIVNRLTGRIFTISFESLYSTAHKPGAVTMCKVIAASSREAIIKAEAAFPEETVESVFGDDSNRYARERPSMDEIIF